MSENSTVLGEYYGIASELAVVVGIVAASFAIAAPLINFFAKIRLEVRERRRSRNTSRYLITPTPEEIKKYSEKPVESKSRHPEELIASQIQKIQLQRKIEKVRARIFLIAIGFLLTFINLALRYALMMVF